jgi:hypothetical protein
MKIRKKRFEDISPIDFLLLRDELGFKKYRKQIKRDAEEWEVLMQLSLKKIEEKEKDDFISIGYRRRMVKILGGKMGSGLES